MYDQNKIFPNKTVICTPNYFGQDAEFALGTSPYGPFTESIEPWNYLAADRAREESADWGNNLFVKKGLGTLVKTYGERLTKLYSIRFTETFRAIKEISYSDVVTVKDTSGNVFTGDACIITVPVSVLEAGKISFTPALPDPYRYALKALKLGSYKKLAIQLTITPKEIEDNVNYYLYNENPNGIWQFYRLSYFPKNTFVVHTAGNFAAKLDNMADHKVFELFKSTFKKAYNEEPIFVEKYGITKWDKNDYALGAYSYTAPVGFDITNSKPLNSRKQMAIPIDNKIFFAGEAYNIKAYGTLHGAYIDGQDAAENALRFLGSS
ncbi:Flavin containing amine oxidoreductase [compost metagenome]